MSLKKTLLGAGALTVIGLLAISLSLGSGGSVAWGSDASGDLSETSTISITTGADTGATSGTYGLLRAYWEPAYKGNGGHDYDFDNDGNPAVEECGNCHMDAASGLTNKHNPPFHPLAIEGTDFGGEWFFDDGQHRGPNTRLADQLAGIRLSGSPVYCGDCHTPTNASGFADAGASGRTSDPHSVHRSVLDREGCIRCHVFDNTTFDRSGNGFGGAAFTQGNATRATYGISNPINMTRVWDGAFLSTVDEANYSYAAGASGLTSAGNGWAVYGSAESGRATQFGCGDCHDQFHAEQGFADTGGQGLEFAFNSSAGSRKGPLAPVKDNESFGVTVSGIDYTCGACHPLDAHAVHTNGLVNDRATFDQVDDASDQSIINDGVLGAELCDECHSQNIGGKDDHTIAHAERGLSGSAPNTHDRKPDIPANFDGLIGTPGENDCGFCHVLR